jgi:hypothetical protein
MLRNLSGRLARLSNYFPRGVWSLEPEDRSQKTGARRQEAEGRRQEAEGRIQKSEVRSLLPSAFCPLSSDS